jgi:hypothetical protein
MLFHDSPSYRRTTGSTGALLTPIRRTSSFAISLLLNLIVIACSSSKTPSGSSNGGAGGDPSQSYTTNFPLPETSLSEAGRWINGGTAGLDWDNVQTQVNFAQGTSPTGKFTDSTAVLAGTWAADQSAEATVRIRTVNLVCCHEVELRLRTTILPHSITGYEINCSVAKGQPYIEIVRWNGALNNFTYVARRNGTGCADGDVLKATIVAGTITVFKNEAEILRGADNNYASGAPGIGFYETDKNVGYYGFSSFTASQDGKPSNRPLAF